MTTRELIAQLQAADPEGNTHVTVGHETITGATRLPAYYDGEMELIEYDPPRAKVVRSGFKVSISTIDVSWFLLDFPNAPVDLSELCEHSSTRGFYEARIAEARECGKRNPMALDNAGPNAV